MAQLSKLCAICKRELPVAVIITGSPCPYCQQSKAQKKRAKSKVKKKKK